MPEAQPLQAYDPRRLGSYELTGRLGSGGQGTVYLGAGEDGVPVAVKLLRVQFDDDATALARFIREAEVAKQVARFCTAQILDADVAGDSPYLVSEYVPGPALNRQVAREGPLEGGALDRLAVSTAGALTAIHRAGIVHRDLKPHNVLLGPDGPRVIDFGLSRVLDASGAVSSRAVGTPAYMAPEQVSGERVGASADVFAWGATMTFAATGTPPFGADNIPAVIYRVLHHEPELGGLGGELRALVEAALDKDPARRPTAAQLLLRLVGHEEAFETAAAAPGTGPGAPGAVAGAGAVEAPGEDTRPGGAAATRPGEGGRAATSGQGAAAGETRLDAPAAEPPPDPAAPTDGTRRVRGLVAGVAAAVVAAIGGAGAYALLDGRDATGAAGSVATSAPASSSSGPSAARSKSREKPAGTGPGRSSAPARRQPSSPGRVPRPSGTRPGGGGGDGPETGDPPPTPVRLGSPAPEGYCAARGRQARIRSGSWYCVRPEGGIGVDTPVTMDQVCAEQYAGSEARLHGAASVPADWDCVVMR